MCSRPFTNVKPFSLTVVAEYEFDIASLVNKKELLQVGDPVQFQVHIGEDFAVNIQATREKLRSYVEAMKGTKIRQDQSEMSMPRQFLAAFSGLVSSRRLPRWLV